MITQLIMGSTAVGALIAAMIFLPAVWRRLQQFFVWRSDLRSIATWAERDRLERERLELVASIYRRWPETVMVELAAMDPVGYEERVRLTREAIGAETLLRVFKARAEAVRITLDARRHKMQICDAKRVGLAVEVSAAGAGAALRKRAGDRPETARELPGRHGRRDAGVEDERGIREPEPRRR